MKRYVSFSQQACGPGESGGYWRVLAGTGGYWWVLVGIGGYWRVLAGDVFGAHVVGRVRGPCCEMCSGGTGGYWRALAGDVFGAHVVGRVRGPCSHRLESKGSPPVIFQQNCIVITGGLAAIHFWLWCRG